MSLSAVIQVRVIPHRWNPYIRDAQITEEIQVDKGASSKSGSYNKNRFPSDCFKVMGPNFKSLLAEANGVVSNFVRQTHNMSFDWQHPFRVMRQSLRSEHEAHHETARDRLRRILVALPDRWNGYKELAQSKLGDSYREEDYPPVEDVARAYGWTVDYAPVLSNEMISLMGEEGRAACEQQMAENLRRAREDTFARLVGPVQTLAERLLENDGESYTRTRLQHMLNALAQLGQTLPDLSPVEDPEFRRAAERVVEIVVRTSEQVLNSDGHERMNVAQGLTGVMLRYGGYARRIVDTDE